MEPWERKGVKYIGYIVVGGELRPLPIGSTLEPKGHIQLDPRAGILRPTI